MIYLKRRCALQHSIKSLIAIVTGIRPIEVDLLIVDPTKARTKLGWECKYDLPALVKEMIKRPEIGAKRPVFKRRWLYNVELF